VWLFKNMNDSIHEIRKGGNLYFLLNAFIGAYNRRTDVMERAVKLDERLKLLTHKLNTSGEALKDAVERNQPNQED
jgi:hypothetical protein